MQTIVPGTRQFTRITYATLPTKRRAYNWELAHASLNASPTGLMVIDEIVDDLFYRFPERFEGKQSKWLSCRNSLANNMTISPDFYKATRIPGEHRYHWALTGSVEGVPRPDKKAKRAGAARPGPSAAARFWKDDGKRARSLRGIHYRPEDDLLDPVAPEEGLEDDEEIEFDPSTDPDYDGDSDFDPAVDVEPDYKGDKYMRLNGVPYPIDYDEVYARRSPETQIFHNRLADSIRLYLRSVDWSKEDL
ncbi:hypothetical protein M407DRAFT_228583 [Tulasnella calospora MUT 4182]|uniref:Uncharacterized protein n=1 Tax=Tulasnella calospora MUT 4182 TaxID=1051891 RepID=A0A0C3K7M9_9AGAM|nr:hypothetical protein M407DRAFT_228583 [Tulasnella calospora MUT 4182]